MRDAQDPILVAGFCLLDWERHRVVLDGKFIELPIKRLRLLSIFMANPDRVLSRDEIRYRLWDQGSAIAATTVDKEVERLRVRLGGLSPHCPIQTVRGEGYLFSTNRDVENITAKGVRPRG